MKDAICINFASWKSCLKISKLAAVAIPVSYGTDRKLNWMNCLATRICKPELKGASFRHHEDKTYFYNKHRPVKSLQRNYIAICHGHAFLDVN